MSHHFLPALPGDIRLHGDEIAFTETVMSSLKTMPFVVVLGSGANAGCIDSVEGMWLS